MSVWSRARSAILVSGAVAASAIAISIPIVTGGGTDPGPAPEGTANLWIDTNGGTCARQASAADYSDTAACSSMQAAASACQAGDTIRMTAGTYGGQSVSTQKASPGCTIIGEQSGSANAVHISGSIGLSGAWMTVRNFDTSGIGASDVGGGLPRNVTYENVNVAGSILFWDGGNDITWRGGSLHDNSINGEGHLVIQGYPNEINNVTVEGVHFYNLTRNATCIQVSCHNEVVRIDDNSSNITLRRNVFEDNDPNSAYVFIGNKNAGGFIHRATGLTLEGNAFDGTGATIKSFNYTCTGDVIRYNTLGKASYPLNTLRSQGGCSDAPGASVTFTGNLGPPPGSNACTALSGVTYDHNVWLSSGLGGCGATDTAISSAGFAADNMHILTGSGAIGKGSPTSCPALDIDGDARPLPTGGTCDAGADEIN